MVEAIGVDIVEVERIRQVISRWGERFLRRVFTPEEIQYCRGRRDSYSAFALRFAAKEAVRKAIGVGRRGEGIAWTDVVVLNDRTGRPQVLLRNRARQRVGERRVLISLSDTRQLAIAQVVLVGP